MADRHLRAVEAKAEPAPRRVEHIDDASLVDRTRAGDKRAEDLLVRRHVAELSRVIGRLLGEQPEQEDVVQDTLVIALEKLHRLQNPAAFRGWLLQIGVNEVRRVYRRRKLRGLVGLDDRATGLGLDGLVSEAASPELRAELSLLDAVLVRFPAEQRIAWMLRYVEGYSLDQVAEASGCSLATAKRRITAAQRKVTAAVTIDEGDLD